MSVILRYDKKISKRDFIHGVMDEFSIDSSFAIRTHQILSKLYYLFRNDESESDIHILDVQCVFQSIIFNKVVRDNPRKVILDLIIFASDMRSDGKIGFSDFSRIILSASVCEEDEIELKGIMNVWIKRFRDQGRTELDFSFINDLLDLVPAIEIMFRDNVMDRLNYRNKMKLFEERENKSNNIVSAIVKTMVMKRFVRSMGDSRLKVIEEWKNEAMQSSRGKMLRYRILYWKVHKLILFWRRQAISTKKCRKTTLILHAIRLDFLKQIAFGRWRSYCDTNCKIRRICLEESDMAKNIALAISMLRLTTIKYQKRMFMKRWIDHIVTERSIILIRTWYNMKILRRCLKVWKHFYSIEKSESYKRQVKRQLSDITDIYK